MFARGANAVFVMLVAYLFQGVYSLLRGKGTMNVYYASTRKGVTKAVREVLEALDYRSILPPGEDILVKVNLTWDYLMPGVDTSPWVLEAFARVAGDHVGRIFLGESSQVLVDASRAYARTGMKEAAERQGMIWHNFSDNPWVRVEAEGLSFGIPEICTRMPVVSIPVVKTHYRSVISVALKHLYGCLDDNRHNYHYRLADYVAAVNSAVDVILTIADGTVSLEGNGPKPGIPKQTDFIAASRDRVALDHSISGAMGIDPMSVETTVKADGKAGSTADLREICIPPLREKPVFEFVRARPNFVARVERTLRGRRKRTGPGTDGQLIGIMKYGAKKWYNLAYHLFGQKRLAQRMVKDCVYGPQWKGVPEEEAEWT